MDLVFIGIVVFLFILAVFDLSVGVSNDAVNFLNSALGSKAGSFKVIVAVAAVGVFVGAVMSNGMMDVARHGIFRPEHFSFFDIMCIFMAVMVTDIILLDLFNTLGMPTSTTVSMVFELLGASFAVALLKMADGSALTLGQLINTEKALSVILGIFLSVAIAFFFGTVVQFISRAVFSFEFKSRLKWKIGLFGGLASTAIVYFLLVKGAKDLVFMTADAKAWIAGHSWLIISACFVFFTLLMQGLHALRVNVLKAVVLLGTFSLAMAFAGNDLVNFIGVPLTGLASWQDFTANGGGDAWGFNMASLNGPADTPFYFLLGAGVIMVVALATSRKAQNVSKTEIGLASQQAGDEMFGSSRLARTLVRSTLNVVAWVKEHTPARVRRWLDRRFDTSLAQPERGAAFDLVRGSVNLMLASVLIAVGTSLKLPLSTTFVTFMVAMGTSLADRAWSRESAVFRVTGVVSVIGGWFITAGAAFVGAAIMVTLMHLGGAAVMVIAALLAVALLIRSNIRFRRRKAEERHDVLFQSILSSSPQEAWPLMKAYMGSEQRQFLTFAMDSYADIALAFPEEDAKALGAELKGTDKEKVTLKNSRRRQTLCLRRMDRATAIENSAWFHLANNSCMTMLYCLRRIAEACREHVDNNFRPLPPDLRRALSDLSCRVTGVLAQSAAAIETIDLDTAQSLRRECDIIKDAISRRSAQLHNRLREGNADDMAVVYVYLNLIQETQEMLSALRKLLRAASKMRMAESTLPEPRPSGQGEGEDEAQSVGDAVGHGYGAAV